MTDPLPEWYDALTEKIASRIEGICSLYPTQERRQVLSAIVRALHLRASDMDASGTWLHLALGAANVVTSVLDDARDVHMNATLDHHPSNADAHDLAEDIALLVVPCGASAPLVAIRTAVLVAWTRFAVNLDPLDRALLAIEATELA